MEYRRREKARRDQDQRLERNSKQNQDETEDSNKRDIRIRVRRLLDRNQRETEKSMYGCDGIKRRWNLTSGSVWQVLHMGN